MSDATKTAAIEPITVQVQVTISAVLVPEADGGYSICVPALPGCVSEADTIEAARAEVVDAIEGWLEATHAGNAAEAVRAMTEPLDSGTEGAVPDGPGEALSWDQVKAQIDAAARPLAEEIACYRRHLPEWAEHEGEHVLIQGGAVLGFHPTRDEALAEGYRRFGDETFLVKQVRQNEKPRTLERVIR